MTIKVNNCGDCIFRESDYDPNSSGYDTVDSCILLKKDKLYDLIAVYDSWVEEKPKELEQRLENCLLDKEQIIVTL